MTGGGGRLDTTEEGPYGLSFYYRKWRNANNYIVLECQWPEQSRYKDVPGQELNGRGWPAGDAEA